MDPFLAGYFVNSLWQVPLLAAGAWLLLLATRPAARTQHIVWIALLPLAIAIPLLSARNTAPQIPRIPTVAPSSFPADEPAVDVSPTVPLAPMEGAAYRVALPDPPPPQSSAPASTAAALAATRMPSPAEFHWPPVYEVQLHPSTTRWIATFYLTTIAFALLRLLFALAVARRVLARARPARLDPAQVRFLDQCCGQLGVRRPVVLESPDAHSPMVVGFLRPALLLPHGFTDHQAGDLEAVWLHELAHLLRRDPLANLLYRLLALPVAYHPATWAVEQRIRQTREMLCDAVAANHMQSPTRYARCLVALARTMRTSTTPVQLHGAAMFDGKSLEERVMQLIETPNAASLRTRALRLACGTAIMFAAIAAAATFHLTPAMAQAAGPQPPLAAQPAAVPAPALPAESASPAAQPLPAARPTPAARPSPAALPEPAAPPDTASLTSEQATRLFEDAMRIVHESLHPGEDGNQERRGFALYNLDAKARSEMAGRASNEAMRNAWNAQIRATVDAQIRAQAAVRNNVEVQKQIAEVEARINSPEFKARMERLNSPEFKRQMEEAQAKFNSPEFKKQMEDLNAKINSAEFKKQIEQATAKVNSPEFKVQIERLNSPEFRMKIEQAKAKVDSPAFREQMEKLNSQIAQAMATINSPEFREQMQKLNSPEFREQMERVNRTIQQQLEFLRKQLRDIADAPPAP